SQTLPQVSVLPEVLADIQQSFFEEFTELTRAAQHGELSPLPDRRFHAAAWNENPGAHAMAHAYLLMSRTMMRLAENVQGSEAFRKRVQFAVMQWVDAVSPANFLALNPDAQQKLVATNGESLRAGLMNLFAD